MISRSDLNDAKAFLCWEEFEHLTIQLVPISSSIAYYFPPKTNLHSIVLFIPERTDDFTEPLFLLFHEAGHVQQYFDVKNPEAYNQKLENADGPERMDFERDAWQRGEELLLKFLHSEKMFDENVQISFRKLALVCIGSYSGMG